MARLILMPTMIDKFTIRDILGYYLTGLYLLFCAMVTRGSIEEIELTGLFGQFAQSPSLGDFLIYSPLVYILGHVIHGVDGILAKAGRRLRSWIDTTRFQKVRLLVAVPKLVAFAVNSPRVTDTLRRMGIDNEQFWTDCASLTQNGKFSRANYWNTIHVLMEGLMLVSFAGLMYSLALCIWSFAGAYAFLTVVFWHRGRQTAVNFVQTVQRSKGLHSIG